MTSTKEQYTTRAAYITNLRTELKFYMMGIEESGKGLTRT